MNTDWTGLSIKMNIFKRHHKFIVTNYQETGVVIYCEKCGHLRNCQYIGGEIDSHKFNLNIPDCK